MKIIKRWSLVLLSLLLALQLTAGLSEAKPQTQVIEAHNRGVGVQYLEPPSYTSLPHGYYRLVLVAQYTYVSDDHPEFCSGVNTVRITIVGKEGSPESVMKGTYHFTTSDKAGWNGTFDGYSVAGAEPNSVRNEIFANGQGWGQLAAYSESVHETMITVNNIITSDTAVATIYLPAK